MFAHQVIEDFKWSLINETLGNMRERVMTRFIGELPLAQQFNFDFDQFDQLDVKPWKPWDDLMEKYHKLIKLPFKEIWVDFFITLLGTGQRQKIGLFITEMDNQVDVLGIQYAIFQKNIWRLGLKTFLVSLGEKWNERSQRSRNIDSHLLAIDNLDSFALESPKEDVLIRIVFSFLILLNCRNIEIVKHLAPEKLNKKREAKGLTPLFTYHTLHIKVFNQKRKTFEAVDPTNIHNRVHLCRGHFKEYTAEAPLFGKYTGLWWWQPNIRGQNRKGIVMKDYEVDTAC